jgi:hypothetical protein
MTHARNAKQRAAPWIDIGNDNRRRLKAHPNHLSVSTVRKLARNYDDAYNAARHCGLMEMATHAKSTRDKLLQLAHFHFKRVPIAEVHTAIDERNDELIDDVLDDID